MLKNFWGRPPRPPSERGFNPFSHSPQQRLRRRLIGFAHSFQSPSWLDPLPFQNPRSAPARGHESYSPMRIYRSVTDALQAGIC